MPFLWSFALIVAAYLLQGLFQKPQVGQKPAAYDDFDFPQYEEGTPQMVTFGDVWSTDWQVIWHGNLRSKGIKKKSGKK